MRQVLVTGATGFVGRQVMAALALRRDLGITVLIRPGAAEKLHTAAFQSLRCIECDDVFAVSTEQWRAWLKGVDTVIHLAWFAEPGVYLQSPRNIDCLAGTLSMARAAVEVGVQRLVGIGTCFEYRQTDEPLSIEMPLEPKTIYAACKVSAYLTLRELTAVSTTSFLWLRLFYLHGEGEDPRRLGGYLHQQLAAGEPAALSSGDQIRDFMDVREAGDRIVELALSAATGARNVCTGQGQSVRQFAQAIAARYAAPHLLKFGARPDNLIDPAYVVGLP